MSRGKLLISPEAAGSDIPRPISNDGRTLIPTHITWAKDMDVYFIVGHYGDESQTELWKMDGDSGELSRISEGERR